MYQYYIEIVKTIKKDIYFIYYYKRYIFSTNYKKNIFAIKLMIL